MDACPLPQKGPRKKGFLETSKNKTNVPSSFEYQVERTLEGLAADDWSLVETNTISSELCDISSSNNECALEIEECRIDPDITQVKQVQKW